MRETCAPDLDEGTRRSLDVPPDLLDLPPDEMRRLGHLVVDLVVDHLAGMRERPALLAGDPATLRAGLGGPLPRDTGHPTGGLAAGLRTLAATAVPHQQHGDHPRYFARVPGPSSFAGVLGEWLATGTQSIASSWGGGAGPTTVELVVVEWLREALGLPPGTEGVLQSGGSTANVTALLAARHRTSPDGTTGVVYLSDQTHSSIARGLLSTGWAPDDVRVLPTGDRYALTADAVRQAVLADLAAGRRPAVVVATAGTTNTGRVDDLDGLADLCAEHGLWLHVDGAYGGPAAVTPRGRQALAGLDRADSLVIDPHKWLFQPYDLACVLVRRPGALEAAFAMHPEYLADVQGGGQGGDQGRVDLHNRSLELTRRGRAFKLWLTFRTYGADRVAAAVDRGIGLAEYAQALVEADPALEVVTGASLGVVTFAAPARDDDAHRRAAAALTASGWAAVSSTVLGGRTVLRLCTINPRTTTADLDGTVGRLSALLAADDRAARP